MKIFIGFTPSWDRFYKLILVRCMAYYGLHNFFIYLPLVAYFSQFQGFLAFIL